jgi:hypothetical protein
MMKEGPVSNSGCWVVFTTDQIIAPDHIIVRGMLGVVVEDPYGLCTTGISTMVYVLGLEDQFGYWDTSFEVRAKEPDEEELQQARQLAENAFDIYHERHGWSGLVKVGKRVMPEKKVRLEIVQLCRKDDPGSAKRLRKIIRSFNFHPDFLKIQNMGREEIEQWNAQALDNAYDDKDLNRDIWD